MKHEHDPLWHLPASTVRRINDEARAASDTHRRQNIHTDTETDTDRDTDTETHVPSRTLR